jgi:hypothetical protein
MYTRSDIEVALIDAKSIKNVLENLGLSPNPGNYRTISFYARKFGITLPVFNYANMARKLGKSQAYSNEEFFSKNTNHTGQRIKRRMIENGTPEECKVCGIIGIWNGKKLQLQVDHIDGDRFNNEIENLRLLCPNCHSQTDTFAGRSGNKGKTKKSPKTCKCGAVINRRSKTCRKCRSGKEKIDWPSDDDLMLLVEEHSIRWIGLSLGVSGNAVKRRLIKRGLI